MRTRIVRTEAREYEVVHVGEIQKVFCRELRVLKAGPELEAVRRQMEAEDEQRRKEAEEKSPERPPAQAPKHRNKRRGRKRRHR